jgi:hypothetical protein
MTGEREGIGSEGRGGECQRARTKVNMRHLDDSQSSVKYSKRITGAHLDRSRKNHAARARVLLRGFPHEDLKRSLHFEADPLLLRRFPRRTFYRVPRRRSKRAGSDTLLLRRRGKRQGPCIFSASHSRSRLRRRGRNAFRMQAGLNFKRFGQQQRGTGQKGCGTATTNAECIHRRKKQRQQ